MSPFGPLIPPQPRVFSRFPEPTYCPPPTTHFPSPFIFITIQIPPHRPSIKISFPFTSLQTPFSATPLFSHQYKTPGCGSISACLFTSHRSRITSHVLSVACSLFAVSLRSFLHSFPLFSAPCSLFSQNTGGVGGYLCDSSAPSAARRYRFLSFSHLVVFRLRFSILAAQG